jgi:hypothetical protein
MAYSSTIVSSSNAKLKVNSYNESLSTQDHRVFDLLEGRAYFYINFFKIQSGKTKQLLFISPDETCVSVIAIYCESIGNVRFQVYGQSDIEDNGTPVDNPPIIARNFHPDFYREPKYQIFEDPEVNNKGFLSIQSMIDGAFTAPPCWNDRSVVTSPNGVALVTLKNEGLTDAIVNMFAGWTEYDEKQ